MASVKTESLWLGAMTVLPKDQSFGPTIQALVRPAAWSRGLLWRLVKVVNGGLDRARALADFLHGTPCIVGGSSLSLFALFRPLRRYGRSPLTFEGFETEHVELRAGAAAGPRGFQGPSALRDRGLQPQLAAG